MTLNVTVASSRYIFQSADFRLVDPTSGKPLVRETQKIVLKSTYSWGATVCFTGVARKPDGEDVGAWLVDLATGIGPDNPFDSLLDGLLEAETWLKKLPTARRLSFTVGAFVEDTPIYALLSNFEEPTGRENTSVSDSLSVYELRPTKPKAYVAGQKTYVKRAERRRLQALVRQNAEPGQVEEALSDLNRKVSQRTDWVSEACITSYLRINGQGGYQVHDPDGNRGIQPHSLFSQSDAVRKLVEREVGPEARIRSVSVGRSATTEAEHKTRIEEDPHSANVYNNYGNLLKEKSDLPEAEKQYRKAIELDGQHAASLTNLANLLWKQGKSAEEAEELFRRAMDCDRLLPNTVVSYARFLVSERDNRILARQVLEKGVRTDPSTGKIHLLRAKLSLQDRNAKDAIPDLEEARERGADQEAVEALYALALHMSGAAVGECIAAYRVAIALTPKDSSLHLNLAQLLFLQRKDREATGELREAQRLDLEPSAELEALFYILAHTREEPTNVIERMKGLWGDGARLAWDMSPNIELVRRSDPGKAQRLEVLVEAMEGKRKPTAVYEILRSWSEP